MQQEVAFPYADIIADIAAHGTFHDSLDSGAESWLIGYIQSVADLKASTWLVLDLVGGFDHAVKMEEDEVKLLLLQHVSTYTCMLTTSYATHSVQARLTSFWPLSHSSFSLLKIWKTGTPAYSPKYLPFFVALPCYQAARI